MTLVTYYTTEARDLHVGIKLFCFLLVSWPCTVPGRQNWQGGGHRGLTQHLVQGHPEKKFRCS